MCQGGPQCRPIGPPKNLGDSTCLINWIMYGWSIVFTATGIDTGKVRPIVRFNISFRSRWRSQWSHPLPSTFESCAFGKRFKVLLPVVPKHKITSTMPAIINWFNEVDLRRDVHKSSVYSSCNTVGFVIDNISFMRAFFFCFASAQNLYTWDVPYESTKIKFCDYCCCSHWTVGQHQSVIDAASSCIDRRFNVECLSVLKHISSLMACRGENFDNAVRQLCSNAKLDGDLCVAEGNLLFYNEAYM